MIARKHLVFGTLAMASTLALAGFLEVAVASEASPATTATGWHGSGQSSHEQWMSAGLEPVLRQLRLTDSQKQQVRSILRTEREQWQAQAGSARGDFVSLANPGDPGHASALAMAETRITQHMQDRDRAEQQIYALLTPEQQAQVPQLLQALQSRFGSHRKARAATASPASGQ